MNRLKKVIALIIVLLVVVTGCIRNKTDRVDVFEKQNGETSTQEEMDDSSSGESSIDNEMTKQQEFSQTNLSAFLSLPAEAMEVDINENGVSYVIEYDWIRLSFTCRLMPDILDAVGCEKASREIAKDHEYSYKASEETVSSALALFGSGILTENMFQDEGYSEVINNLCVLDTGASGSTVFYENSAHTSVEDLIISELAQVSYIVEPTGVYRFTVYVDNCDFAKYYEGLSTDVERNTAKQQMERVQLLLQEFVPDYSSYNTNGIKLSISDFFKIVNADNGELLMEHAVKN